MSEFKQYIKSSIAEMRPYVPNTILPKSVSISKADRENGSPKAGDMIARNPKNHNDQWLVAKEFFEENYKLLEEYSKAVSDYSDYGDTRTGNTYEEQYLREKSLHIALEQGYAGSELFRQAEKTLKYIKTGEFNNQ